MDSVLLAVRWGGGVTPEPVVGHLVRALAEGVRDELGEIRAALEGVRLRITRLGEDARAVNGLGGDCSGWANHLTTVMDEISKEQTEVPAKLLGQPLNPIVQSVDSEHAEKVSRARRTA